MSTEYLTVEQIAQEHDLSEETVPRWIRRRDLKADRLGKTYRVTKKDHQEFLDQRYTGKLNEEEE